MHTIAEKTSRQTRSEAGGDFLYFEDTVTSCGNPRPYDHIGLIFVTNGGEKRFLFPICGAFQVVAAGGQTLAEIA